MIKKCPIILVKSFQPEKTTKQWYLNTKEYFVFGRYDISLNKHDSNGYLPVSLCIISDDKIYVNDLVYIEGHDVLKKVIQINDDDYELDNGLPYIKEKCHKVIAHSETKLNSEILQIKKSLLSDYYTTSIDGKIIKYVDVVYYNVIPQSNGKRTDGYIFDEIALDESLNTLAVPALKDGYINAKFHLTINKDQLESVIREFLIEYNNYTPAELINKGILTKYINNL